MDKKSNGLLKKTKPISLAPCSENGNMWNSTNADQDVPEVLISQPEIPMSKSGLETKDKLDKSPLEATFTHPNESLEDKGLSELKQKQKKASTDYTALEFVSTSSQANSLTLSINCDDKQLTRDRSMPEQDEMIRTAIVAFSISIFCPLWSILMAYWQFKDGDLTASLITLVILAVSTLAVHMAFFTARSSPKSEMWKTSKCITLLCLIPGLPSIVLSFCNVIFAIRETRSRSYERPWSNTRAVFLVESLAFAFPQAVLHLILLSEQPELIHSIKGYVTIFGVALFSFAITFARFRYDSSTRFDRFGDGFEKYVRFAYIWANKVLWIVMYTLVIVSLRLSLPNQKTTTTIVGIGLMLAFLEVPILLSMIPAISRVAQSLLELLMMIPQFVALSALIVWVRVDPNVYNFDNGCFVLGIFFYAEAITLTGWLYDRCMAREIDFIPVYPHFFGDLMTTFE